MEIIRILIFILLFVLITSSSYYIIIRYFSERSIHRRLGSIRTETLDELNPLRTRLEIFSKNMLTKLINFSMPDEEWESSRFRIRFMRAGYYRELDALIFFALKTVLTLVLPILYVLISLIGRSSSSLLSILSVAVLLSGIGYYLPDIWLSRKVKERKQQIFESLPNALDLMRVCISAGLGLDSAIERVGKELQIESKALAQEFHILNLELRTGATRENALKNLADRTGVEDIHALVAMLIQTEHFGTSISEALKVHADSLREKRALMAQEVAATIPVKMTIPLILCIFPALMVVLLGPAIITIGKSLSPIFNGIAK
ncbi:type II secretion system F family protein [Polynucleobacter sp. AP-Reno-20A-A9]|uniref:type II secretion system F family protein n=1 Tax=Polynucleobacter sp. AP-Reno-20A-A9 TaxID=2576925 RepID=UPI001C0D5DB4|nr:type II secretion system F family protein [Polynucleobacter sp. AP-Reno-20A-A9]MBU3628870.1 type II secretion system F family protein [Polynucleobacter sp. AP-Reno-20A-A9]